jgi:hypothetical protein
VPAGVQRQYVDARAAPSALEHGKRISTINVI